MTNSGIRVERRGTLCFVTLDRPEQLNAIDREMHTVLAQLWRQLDDDPTVRTVVLTGAGRAFSGGGDLAMARAVGRDERLRQEVMREAEQLIAGMLQLRIPVVTAVRGPAVGLGCSLVLLSDIVFMAETAYLADPHVSLGLVAGDGGAVMAPLLASPMKVKEFLLTGRRLGAAEAERIGLATHVVPDADLAAEATAVAERIATLPAQAVQDTLRAMKMHLRRAAAGVMEFALEAETRSLAAPEHRERIDALATPG